MTRMLRSLRADPRQEWLGFIVFAILGVLGNALSVPLFFGVDVIFGSIACLIAIVWLGPRLGLAVTVIAASYTFFLWNHFYAATVFIAEGVFVAWVLPRLRYNLALASMLFWIFIGIPLHAALYHWGLGMDILGVQLATVKQATSGIFNSIIASLFLSYTPFILRFRSRRNLRIPVYQHIFNIFVGAALIPAAVLLVLDARAALKDIENAGKARLETVATGTSQATVGWLQQQQNAVLSVAWQIGQMGRLEPARLQPLVESVRPIWQDFVGAFVLDESGTTIAFDPLQNAQGQSTLGLNFRDRTYFSILKAGARGAYISDVFMARGGVFEPVFNVSAPILIEDQFRGIVSGSLNLKNVLLKLHEMLKESEFQATLVDRNGNVIVSDNPEYLSLTAYSPQNLHPTEDLNEKYYYRLASGEDLSPMLRWNRSYLGVSVDLPVTDGWKLYVEQPMEPLRAVLYGSFIRNMAYLLGLSLVILFGSMAIARRIAKPLAQLSNETTNLPQRLEQREDIQWPASSILELNAVTENFKSMVIEFKNRFIELETSRNQLKIAKDEAETANRMKSSFLANMSHEIRTPLGIIVGFTDLLLADGVDLDQKKEFASGLKRNAKQLSLLIEDILDLSKVEAGHLTLDFEEFALRPILKDVVADFVPKTQDSALEIFLTVADEVPDDVVSDPVRLKQILINLIGNAVKFTPKGRIDVDVRRDAAVLRIAVKDQGAGISAEDQAKLFKPFSQVDESLTRKFGGTGLGLALSKRLAKLLGGDLILAGSRVGEGSTFELSIPIGKLAETRRPRMKAMTAPAPQRSMAGLSILLVEDSADNQALITHLLERAGAKVAIADNGKLGAEMALAGHYDYVLMDLQMPVMDGLTAARLLRDRGYDKPLIALTAHAMAEFRDKCLEAGFDEHVAKPIQFEDLLRAMSESPKTP